MCRNIKILFNFEPPVTDEEVRAASLQFVRKISGFSKPSKANEKSFATAVDEIAGISARLLRSAGDRVDPTHQLHPRNYQRGDSRFLRLDCPRHRLPPRRRRRNRKSLD